MYFLPKKHTNSNPLVTTTSQASNSLPLLYQHVPILQCNAIHDSNTTFQVTILYPYYYTPKQCQQYNFSSANSLPLLYQHMQSMTAQHAISVIVIILQSKM